MRFSALVLFFLINTSVVQAQPQEQFTPEQNQWTGAVEQRVWGLMTVWATAKYAFPHFKERPDLDWDKKVQEYIPKVIGVPDMNSYYLVLMEFAALLKDGHTGVIPPWGHFPPGQDTPPI
jgi:hypothetical protein